MKPIYTHECSPFECTKSCPQHSNSQYVQKSNIGPLGLARSFPAKNTLDYTPTLLLLLEVHDKFTELTPPQRKTNLCSFLAVWQTACVLFFVMCVLWSQLCYPLALNSKTLFEAIIDGNDQAASGSTYNKWLLGLFSDEVRSLGWVKRYTRHAML